MNFDSDFLYEYLTADNGRIWSEPIDLLMFDWYRDINNGTIEETVLPVSVQMKIYKIFLQKIYSFYDNLVLYLMMLKSVRKNF